jgi:lipid A disaccharide synthetase
VWVWRPGRAKKLKPLVDHILALFPFEPEVLRRLGGPPTSYVGHPLLDKLDQLRPSRDDERRRNEEPPLLLVLPGSRTTEIERLAPLFGDVVAKAAQQRQLTAFARLDEIFDKGTEAAGARAARIVMEVYENKRKLIGAARHSQ